MHTHNYYLNYLSLSYIGQPREKNIIKIDFLAVKLFNPRVHGYEYKHNNFYCHGNLRALRVR